MNGNLSLAEFVQLEKQVALEFLATNGFFNSDQIGHLKRELIYDEVTSYFNSHIGRKKFTLPFFFLVTYLFFINRQFNLNSILFFKVNSLQFVNMILSNFLIFIDIREKII